MLVKTNYSLSQRNNVASLTRWKWEKSDSCLFDSSRLEIGSDERIEQRLIRANRRGKVVPS